MNSTKEPINESALTLRSNTEKLPARFDNKRSSTRKSTMKQTKTEKMSNNFMNSMKFSKAVENIVNPVNVPRVGSLTRSSNHRKDHMIRINDQASHFMVGRKSCKNPIPKYPLPNIKQQPQIEKDLSKTNYILSCNFNGFILEGTKKKEIRSNARSIAGSPIRIRRPKSGERAIEILRSVYSKHIRYIG